MISRPPATSLAGDDPTAAVLVRSGRWGLSFLPQVGPSKGVKLFDRR